jgi:hypothetical protein
MMLVMAEAKRPGRLNIQLTPGAEPDLESLLDTWGTNRTVLTSRAIRIYKRLTDAEQAGCEVVIHHLDGSAERVSLLP